MKRILLLIICLGGLFLSSQAQSTFIDSVLHPVLKIKDPSALIHPADSVISYIDSIQLLKDEAETDALALIDVGLTIIIETPMDDPRLNDALSIITELLDKKKKSVEQYNKILSEL